MVVVVNSDEFICYFIGNRIFGTHFIFVSFDLSAKRHATPSAQNRLKANGKTVIAAMKINKRHSLPISLRESKVHRLDSIDTLNASTTCITSKTYANVVVDGKKPETSTSTESSEYGNIPNIFAPKAPAQDRLKRLQNRLNDDKQIGCDVAMKKTDLSDAVDVIRNEFGIDGDWEMSGALNEPNDHCDEMEWETSNAEVIILNRSSDLAYLVPDTNVFLDSLRCLERAIDGNNTFIFCRTF